MAAATVLVYSDDPRIREQVRLALGRRPAADVGPLQYVEAATQDEVISLLHRGGVDLAVLDGEAAPAGGMGVCRQARDEVASCPPMLVLVGRRDDAWLATWSRADATLLLPVDPVQAAASVARMLRAAPAEPTG